MRYTLEKLVGQFGCSPEDVYVIVRSKYFDGLREQFGTEMVDAYLAGPEVIKMRELFERSGFSKTRMDSMGGAIYHAMWDVVKEARNRGVSIEDVCIMAPDIAGSFTSTLEECPKRIAEECRVGPKDLSTKLCQEARDMNNLLMGLAETYRLAGSNTPALAYLQAACARIRTIAELMGIDPEAVWEPAQE